jgi:CRP/FNR family cyclic AMP-dependent transcriptional regulator
LQLVSEIPLFSKMDDEERSELHSLMTERVFPAGQVIMKAGELGNAFQIIQQGQVELWLIDSDGQRVVLDILGSGKFFGELSILSGETRNATATSDENVTTLELGREELFDFLRRRPEAALDILTELGDRLKRTDDILRTRASRNPNDAIDEQHVSIGQSIADVIATFSGSLPFLFLNFVIFVVWITINLAGPTSIHFDPYPFQFLTMSVSLEAIFLSIFVLVSQNRQSLKDRLKADLDYRVDVKTELEMSIISSHVRDIERKLHHMHSDLLEGKAEIEHPRPIQ